MKRLSVIGGALSLSACAVSSPYPTYEITKNPDGRWPSVGLQVNNGEVPTSTTCHQYGCYATRDDVHERFLKTLQRSGKFQTVELNNAFALYKLVIETDSVFHDSGFLGFTKMLLGAATLFALPMHYSQTYSANVTLFKGNKPVDMFQYTRESSEWQWLPIDYASYRRNAYVSIANNLVYDLDQRDAFE